MHLPACISHFARSDLADPSLDEEAPLGRMIQRQPLVIAENSSLREAADRMVTEGVGRLVVVRRDAPRTVAGILTRSDVLGAHRPRLAQAREARAVLRVRRAPGASVTRA